MRSDRFPNADGPDCTLVVPTYNAAAFIDGTVHRLRRFVHEHPNWRVLFVCDGCTDSTPSVLTNLIRDDGPALRAEIYEQNRGKGYALRRGLSLAHTPYRFFTDVDLAYDPDSLLPLMQLLVDGADIAVANRASSDSCFLISPRDFPNIYRRHLMSRVFNWWLRRMLPIRILDTQAGLKGMTADVWEQLEPAMCSDGFFFDVELLGRAGQAGMRIEEAPVTFRYLDPTTVRMVRHGYSMIFETLWLRRQLKKEKRARECAAAADLRAAA